MNEGTRKKVVYGASVLALAWAAYNFPSGRQKPSQTDNYDTSAQPIVASAVTNVPEKLIDVELYQSLEWGADPFRIPEKLQTRRVQQVVKNWKLSGIVYSPDNPMAIINATTVGIGDIIENAKVIKIDRKKVTINYKGSQITLTVTKG